MNRPKKITMVNKRCKDIDLVIDGVTYNFKGEGDSVIVPYSTVTTSLGNNYVVDEIDDYEYVAQTIPFMVDGFTEAEVIAAKGEYALFASIAGTNAALKKHALGIITQAGIATATKIITIGTRVFTFMATVTGTRPIVVSATLKTQAVNIANAINADTACLATAIALGTYVLLINKVTGIIGNDTIFTTDEANLTITGAGTLIDGVA